MTLVIKKLINYDNFYILPTSLLLAFITFSNHDLNRDGIAYLQQATLISEGYDLTSIIKHYPWPFFSYLIYIISKITTIDFYVAAKLINLTFTSVSIIIFVKIMQYLTDNKTIYIASVAVVLSFIPLIDNYLSMILRDHGAWCFFLFGIFFALKFIKEKNYIFNFYSQISFLIGFLFRPDILVLMLASSIILFFNNKNLKHLFKSNILITILLFVLSIYALLDISSIQNSRLIELWERPLSLIYQFYSPLNIESKDFMLNQYFSENFMEVKLGLLSTIFIIKWFSGFGLFHLVLSYFGKKNINNYLSDRKFENYILWFLFTSIFIVYVNMFVHNVVTVRYLIPSYLIAMIFSTIGLHYIWYKYKKNKLINIFLIIIIFIHIASNAFDKQKKSIELDAANWLVTNNVIIENLYSNNERIIFDLRTK